MDLTKTTYNYFLILFSIIPVSILVGPSVSLFVILLIDISFIFLIIKKKNYSFFKNDTFKYLLFLYLYLIFNSLISIDISSGMYRNFGFIRILILFVAFNFFFHQKLFFDKVFKIWLITLLIVAFDVFFEYFNGVNLLGFPEIRENQRLVSFFKDEPIVGAYMYGFYLLLIGFLMKENFFKQKNIIFLLLIILFLAIFLTGERSNSIKAFLGIFLLIFFFKEIPKKIKLISLIFALSSLVILISNSDKFKMRYVVQIKSALGDKSIYFNLYKSGYQVFKNYPIFGVGNKNYRIESCDNFEKEHKNEKYEDYLCTTHPHQIYFELLSEHGIVGTLIILLIFFKLIFSKIFSVLKNSNYIQIGSMIFLLLTFLPIIPSGSFFNDFAITIFAINLSLFYASNKKFNIFYN